MGQSCIVGLPSHCWASVGVHVSTTVVGLDSHASPESEQSTAHDSLVLIPRSWVGFTIYSAGAIPIRSTRFVHCLLIPIPMDSMIHYLLSGAILIHSTGFTIYSPSLLLPFQSTV